MWYNNNSVFSCFLLKIYSMFYFFVLFFLRSNESFIAIAAILLACIILNFIILVLIRYFSLVLFSSSSIIVICTFLLESRQISLYKRRNLLPGLFFRDDHPRHPCRQLCPELRCLRRRVRKYP